ncbi:MAG: hypothetical protein ACI87M_000576, partial [Yoonia sp.]
RVTTKHLQSARRHAFFFTGSSFGWSPANTDDRNWGACAPSVLVKCDTASQSQEFICALLTASAIPAFALWLGRAVARHSDPTSWV